MGAPTSSPYVPGPLTSELLACLCVVATFAVQSKSEDACMSCLLLRLPTCGIPDLA